MSPTAGSRRRFCQAGVALLALSLASPTFAFERLQRRFSQEQGLPFSEVTGLAQDTSGFLWVAASGLFRYDGVEMRPWPGGSFRPLLGKVAAGPGGEVVARGYDGNLYQVQGRTLFPLAGPPIDPGMRPLYPVFDGAGRLWVVADHRLWGRVSGGEWEAILPSVFDGDAPTGLQATIPGELLVETSGGLWRFSSARAAERLASGTGFHVAALGPAGKIVALLEDGTVVELVGGARRELFRSPWRPIDLLVRGDTTWVSYDNGLVALRPDAPPEILGPLQGVPSGGPLLVDREGSLWLGTFRGLLQFPCPETVAWGAAEGLSSVAPRRLAAAPDGIAVDTWHGLYFMRRSGGSFRPEQIPGTVSSAPCVGAGGGLWGVGDGELRVLRGGRLVVLPVRGLAETYSCVAGAGSRVWLSTNLGILLGLDGAAVPLGSRLIAEGPHGVAITDKPQVVEDSGGHLWLAAGEQACSTAAAALAAGRADWRCERLDGVGQVFSITALPSGSVWVATLRSGVWRHAPGGAWEAILGSRQLPAQAIRTLRPSPAGGVWVVSFGTVLRVLERADSADGWEVVERPSPWQGLMISDAEDVLEEPGGDLWITTLAGLVQMPAAVRRSTPAVPGVQLVESRVDGTPLDATGSIVLSHRRNRIELRFAAPSFRDPGLLRYEARLRPDAPWIAATGSPTIQFVDLQPGAYHAEARASLDGVHWSPVPASLSFRVLPPFWRTPWFLAVVAAFVLATGYALFRYRMAQSLALERTRTRIAADLHDDIGASLSRIALQSELLRRPEQPQSDEKDRRLGEIAEAARALVDAMSDIVWSIDPRRDDLASLIARVREFALGLLEPGGIALDLETPDGAERLRLAPERRRHLYLILKEAIHNVAKHSRCRLVRIRVCVDGGKLLAEVADDGQGLAGVSPAAAQSRRGGHGLPGMRDRAARMHGTLEIRSAPGEGTSILLEAPVGRGGA